MKDTPKKKREFGVVLESIDSKVQHIVEAVDTHTAQLQRLQSVPDSIAAMKDDIEAIKVTTGIMKNDLKQKVDREEFVALENRVALVEAKLRD